VDYHPYLPREDGRLPMSDFGGVHRYNVTGLVHDMWGFPSDNPKIVHGLLRHLVDKIENNAGQMARYRTFYLEDAETVLVSFGSSARSALHIVESLRPRGQKIGLLELQTLWPFPAEVIRHYCNTAKTTVVVEMNMGQVCQMVKTTVDAPGAGVSGQPHRRGVHHTHGHQEHTAPDQGQGGIDGSQRLYPSAVFPHLWCSGCGHGIVLNGLIRRWSGWG
jgi:pyruvate/2-oxoacid:ferredoxin oxidoreductase alpha subunit